MIVSEPFKWLICVRSYGLSCTVLDQDTHTTHVVRNKEVEHAGFFDCI